MSRVCFVGPEKQILFVSRQHGRGCIGGCHPFCRARG